MTLGKLAAGALALSALSVGLALGARPAAAATTAHTASPGSLTRPWPITITIHTVPALQAVKFSFDGRPVTTNAQGTVSVTDQHNFDGHTLVLMSTSVIRSGRHYHFARWAGQRDPQLAFRSTVTGLPMRTSYTITAGFAAQCPVAPRFVTQRGELLDPARIGRVILRSSTGEQVILAARGTSWLACSRLVYRNNSLYSIGTRYSVQRVAISGDNVVQAGAERFNPMTNARPTFVGYFHRLTITAHDALFGGKTGTVAIVRSADGSVRRAMLGSGHSVTLDLPQGRYGLTVRVAGSIVLDEQLRLSHDRTVNFTAVSHADLLSITGAALIVAASLPFLSKVRRRRLGGLLHRSLRRSIAAPPRIAARLLPHLRLPASWHGARPR